MLLLAAGAGPAGAARPETPAPPAGRVEITPFAGARLGGRFEDSATGADVEFDAGGSGGLIVNLRARANTEWEFGWSRQSTSVDLGPVGGTAADVDVDYFQLGGTYLWDGRVARPFMAATIGVARFAPDAPGPDDETWFAFSIGGGWKVLPTRRVGLRLEGRVYGTVVDSDSALFCAGGAGAACLVTTRGQVLWQWEFSAGATFRF